MDNEKLIESIKDICRNNNITVTKLEEELSMSQGLIGRWAKSDPSLSKIIDIADYFHISLDEVVGYHNVVNDKFLEKLISQTAAKTIKWNNYVRDNIVQPKQYYDPSCEPQGFYSQEEADEFYNTHKEISYFAEISNIYISLYGMYEYHNVITPSEIKLFIQPGEEAQLIEQDYSYEQLKVLWLKVLYMLGDNAPDEIKVEEFKNSFINDFKKPEPIKKKKKIIFVTNPQTQKIIETTINKLYGEKGCVLYNIDTNLIIDKDDALGVTNNGLQFYLKNKNNLGRIFQVNMKNGKDLFLISNSKIMKLSGFSWGENRGNNGFDGLIQVLSDAGFDPLDENLKSKDNYIITRNSYN